jgi:hypothetical protein
MNAQTVARGLRSTLSPLNAFLTQGNVWTDLALDASTAAPEVALPSKK